MKMSTKKKKNRAGLFIIFLIVDVNIHEIVSLIKFVVIKQKNNKLKKIFMLNNSIENTCVQNHCDHSRKIIAIFNEFAYHNKVSEKEKNILVNYYF